MKKNIDVCELLNNFSVNLTKSSDRIVAARAASSLKDMIEAADYLKRDASNDQWAEFHAALARIKGIE